MNKTPTDTPKTEETKFDGVIEILEPQLDGSYTKRKEKFYLSDDEVKEFMGDADPSTYWRLGRVPVAYKKEFGNLLKADAQEKIVCDKVFAKFPGILLFRHPFQALYTLLVPKKYSSIEKDNEGEYVNRLLFCDARSIVFGANDGGAYSDKNFTRKANLILKNLVRTNSDDYISEL